MSVTRRELLAASGVAGVGALAGCSGVTSQTFEATPVVLASPGQELLGLTEFDLVELTKTNSVADVGELTLTSYLSVHSSPSEGDPPYRFGRSAPGFHYVGALATPAPDVVGEWVNPVASKPLVDLLTGTLGRQLLQQTGVVDASTVEWVRPPTEVGTTDGRLLDEPMEAKSFMGVVDGGDAGPSTLLMNLTRVVTGGDAVVVGEFMRRLTPPEPLDVDGSTLDDLHQFLRPRQVDMWRRYRRGLKQIIQCRELATPGGSIEVCENGGDTGPPLVIPSVSIENARLVQHVENTVVKTKLDRKPTYSEPDPHLVKGENTAAVFEFDTLEHLDALTGPLEIQVSHGKQGAPPSAVLSFEIPKRDLKRIKGGEDTISALHRLANDGSTDNDNPVFELTDDAEVELTTKNFSGVGFDERITPSKKVVDVDPLHVGFVPLQDKKRGARYGDGRGLPKSIRRSFESATEYLQRAYPGNVVSAGYLSHAVVGGTTLFQPKGDHAVVKDMKRARRLLNRSATDPSYPSGSSPFPNDWVLRTDGMSRSTVVDEIKRHGFDVVVVIVPEDVKSNPGATDYYSYHDMDCSGVTWGNPSAAVSIRGATAAGSDRLISQTVAQEVGHKFQSGYRGPTGDPMAQRRNDKEDHHQLKVNGVPIDPAHARHQTSTMWNGVDFPGVISTAYDLKDSFANVQSFRNPAGSFTVTGPNRGATSVGKVPSYMSYSPHTGKTWADARIHQQLIDCGWVPPGTSGGGNSAYMLSASGAVTEDGTVRYDDVSAAPGVERYTDVDGAPVVVELLDPAEEVLARSRVPVEFRGSHPLGVNVGPRVAMPSFDLPFADAGVRVRTTHDGATSHMNPIARSVRDAVRRVPEAGFEGEPAADRDSIFEALDRMATAMDHAQYGEAAAVMAGPVRERIQGRVVEYEFLLGQPTVETLTALADEMTRRLRALA